MRFFTREQDLTQIISLGAMFFWVGLTGYLLPLQAWEQSQILLFGGAFLMILVAGFVELSPQKKIVQYGFAIDFVGVIGLAFLWNEYPNIDQTLPAAVVWTFVGVRLLLFIFFNVSMESRAHVWTGRVRAPEKKRD